MDRRWRRRHRRTAIERIFVKVPHFAALAATALSATPAPAQLSAAAQRPASAQLSATFTLTVTDLHSSKGQIMACLWRDKDTFPSCEKSATALKRTFPVTGTTMHVTLPLPAAGRYAEIGRAHD